MKHACGFPSAPQTIPAPRESDIPVDEVGLKSGGKMGPSHLEAGQGGRQHLEVVFVSDSEHLPANVPLGVCVLYRQPDG